MAMITTNTILKRGGLYDDVIGVVGDYLYGTRAQYKGVYDICMMYIKANGPKAKGQLTSIKTDMTVGRLSCYSGYMRYRIGFILKSVIGYTSPRFESRSYNDYMWEYRYTDPLKTEMAKRNINKCLFLLNQAKDTQKKLGITTRRPLTFGNGITEDWLEKFGSNPNYFEGVMSAPIQCRLPTITVPYYKTRPREIQNKIENLNREIRQHYINKHTVKSNRKFDKGYIVYENDFIKIEVRYEKNDKLYCNHTAKPLRCGHARCAEIHRRNKVKTKTMIYKIHDNTPMDNRGRYVNFDVGIYRHEQYEDTRLRNRRYESEEKCNM